MIKKADNSKNWWACGKDRNPFILLLGTQNATATLENSWSIPQMVQELLSDPAIPLVSTHPRGMKTYVYTNTCTRMFIAMLFIIAQKQKQLKWPLTDELIKKNVVLLILWHIIQPQKGTKYWFLLQHGWTLKTLCLSERQSQKMTYCMISCIWNFQKRQIYRDGK